MRKILSAAGFVLCAASAFASGENLLQSLPLRFEPAPNGSYRYVSRGAGYAVAFSDTHTVLAAGHRAVRLRFEGARDNARFEPLEKSAADTNYLRREGSYSVPAYARLKRTGVYPGIDVVYYGTGGNLEYDFELAPGADPGRIALRFDGADAVRLTPAGDLELELGDDKITQKLPVVYQRTASNELTSVHSSYRIAKDGSIRLNLGGYDKSKALTIDPSLLLSAYLPGTGAEGVVGIARDSKGFLYMAGYTFSTDFALVGDGLGRFLLNNLREGWITKINPDASGNELIVYSTFFGSSATDDPRAVTVDDAGVMYLTGITDSFDYPTTPNGYVTSFTGGTNRIFVAKIDTTLGPEGLLYSTYFGGTKTDAPTAIAAVNGKIYLTGYTTSDDFPVAGALNANRLGSYDAFISVFDPALSGTESLAYSTYFGGSGQDLARSLAVAADGSVYIAGGTYSGDFPTTSGAYRTYYSGLGDAFVSRLNIAENRVTYSTYFGGSDTDQARKLVLAPGGRVAITGYTFSYDLPISQNAVQPVYAANGDIFLAVLNPGATDAGGLVYGTYLGGLDGEVAYDMRVDGSGKYYLCGYTLSKDFPIRNALYPVSAFGGSDAFVSVIDPAALPSDALVSSTFFTSPGMQVAYGIDVDPDGNITVTGVTTGVIFEPGQAMPVIPSNTNVWLARFRP